MLGDADAAADAMQTVFVKVFEKRHTLKAEYPSSLLWRIATNHCLNVIRERAARGETVRADALLSTIACSDDLEERVGSRSVLRKLFGRHPESSRVIAVLHYVGGNRQGNGVAAPVGFGERDGRRYAELSVVYQSVAE
jgi:RNA polymerase sigma-70 factor, ECF subfamily